jgi:ADP-ribose pyrophosphatase YjhB (NUDIX family)
LEHRIRAAAIIVQDDKILLVRHQHPVTGLDFWVPPGGGLEGDETIYECARREAHEETGLNVELGEIVYLREFVDLPDATHHLEVFILARSFEGELTTANLRSGDEDFSVVKEARFLSREDIAGLTVYPEILKDEFWSVLASKDGLTLRYLGLQKVDAPWKTRPD